ncbi:hypothetical protein PoB_004217700 [Plakobranchus ocellatus]|uniref:Uncharacterized protein n=1 Tax=Plakobranchus ocellatus TaxID=259542 RepID=A0AAV4B900_9GAST|nr:hypothetical protein PoB_004217700 [Plakobranchus ocellatus]
MFNIRYRTSSRISLLHSSEQPVGVYTAKSCLRQRKGDKEENRSEQSCCPQQSDLRLLAPASGQGAGSGVRTLDRRVAADLRADSLTTVPPTPPTTQASTPPFGRRSEPAEWAAPDSLHLDVEVSRQIGKAPCPFVFLSLRACQGPGIFYRIRYFLF